ncbi:hypothetical protein CSAL01_03196 [Colletotrichum salicis]|uniref:Uncharacterized protein n=1 Tax=Colletotrichum salicis TaxID=1209931 RepID=A0A135U8P9_9PEZI|nr:hypothetical protein CSAL01_03196 [Colletotrichum salicis]
MKAESVKEWPTQTLVFTIAGSVLGKIKAADEREFTSEQYTINRTIERWRKFVLQRLSRTYQIIGLRTIQRAIALLVKVWSRMDFETAPGDRVSDSVGNIAEYAHWIGVIEDEGLETLLS